MLLHFGLSIWLIVIIFSVVIDMEAFMNIEHLEYLLEVYNCGSINKAAKYHYISQSHLSKIIKNLENELGYTLIIRSKSGLTFTHAGTVFIKSAEKIVQESNNIRKIPEQLEKDEALSIVCSSDPFLLNTFFDFRRMASKIHSNETLEEAGLRIILQRLISKERNLGIMAMFEQKAEKYRKLAEKYGLGFETLQTHIPMIVVMNPRHPLAKKEAIRLEDMAKYDFIVDSNVDNDDTKTVLQINSEQNVLHVSSLACTVMALKKSNYIAVKNQTLMQHVIENGLITREIEGFEEYSGIYLLHQKNKPVPAREKQFIAYLKKQLCIQFR